MKTIAIIYGTRPQIIKVNMLVKQFEKHADEYRLVLIDTGQHYSPELAGNIYKELGLRKPDYQLDAQGDPVMAIANIIGSCGVILNAEHPDLVCVVGDTNSTLAGAIAAKRSGFKLAHIEAGLRSHDNSMPEEQNRILADTMADLRFWTHTSREYPSKGDYYVGDLMEESFWHYSKKHHGPAAEYWLNKIKDHPFNLMTIHREENTSKERLTEIISAVGFLAQTTVWPVHPRISNLPYFEEIKKLAPKILYVDPMGYLETLSILNACKAVLTDSGGLYREAVWANKPVVVIRTSTEFNTSRLVDFVTREAIVTKYYETMLEHSKGLVGSVSTPPVTPPSELILQAITEYLRS
jgi:UDP-N-acetylglucosamine 2-epimerase